MQATCTTALAYEAQKGPDKVYFLGTIHSGVTDRPLKKEVYKKFLNESQAISLSFQVDEFFERNTDEMSLGSVLHEVANEIQLPFGKGLEAPLLEEEIPEKILKNFSMFFGIPVRVAEQYSSQLNFLNYLFIAATVAAGLSVLLGTLSVNSIPFLFFSTNLVLNVLTISYFFYCRNAIAKAMNNFEAPSISLFYYFCVDKLLNLDERNRTWLKDSIIPRIKTGVYAGAGNLRSRTGTGLLDLAEKDGYVKGFGTWVKDCIVPRMETGAHVYAVNICHLRSPTGTGLLDLLKKDGYTLKEFDLKTFIPAVAKAPGIFETTEASKKLKKPMIFSQDTAFEEEETRNQNRYNTRLGA